MSAKRRSSGKFAPPVVKSTIKAPKTTIDESRAAVSATDSLQAAINSSADPIEISSGEESDEYVSDEDMGAPDAEADEAKESVNGKEDAAEKQTPKTDAAAEGAESDDEAGSPTFGELLRGTIDVPAILSQQGDSSKAVTSLSSRKSLAPPSLNSLSTVLTQALKTEDNDLLESCLEITSLDTLQQTIERLDSSLAGVLLTKLATRLHRRPGRAGSLMIWVKWTLIFHGGALAVQPKVLERLVSLQKVLNERSRGLPSLLALKGKLDMLEGQMQLRKTRSRRQRPALQGREEEEEYEDEEEGAIYVEGEEDHEEADVDMANGVSRNALLGDEDDDEAVPTTNGFVGDSDDDDDEEDVVAAEDESDAEEEVDEEDVDHDDVEDSMDDEDDSDAEAAPPAKVQKTASSFTKRK
ncbi:U3 small nucleolar RNA-associated protein [Colletotrichum plurivorum]|uniref:U3 small nucleolar RNA-associated protein n=1 Tax=Colletotrichum plurivorum TaxID=2175906 RepID=A0A8H6JR67_9PEZI|nr:U3 small nucleolar RNA-associated protein [Colletotrichum plurivorum]